MKNRRQRECVSHVDGCLQPGARPQDALRLLHHLPGNSLKLGTNSPHVIPGTARVHSFTQCTMCTHTMCTHVHHAHTPCTHTMCTHYVHTHHSHTPCTQYTICTHNVHIHHAYTHHTQNAQCAHIPGTHLQLCVSSLSPSLSSCRESVKAEHE